MRKGFTLLALLGTLALGWAQREVKPGFNLFSKDQDVQLGREAAAQVQQQMPVVRDAEINEYIQNVGRRLASQPQADRYPYSFQVVAEQSINAFALPGGPTFVHTGLMAAADNEAQLVGVMAHEIAHVALRHGTNQASKANLLQLPAALAGAVAGGNGSMLGQLAQLGIGLGANGLLLKYSRNAERDADILGSRMMAQAGWNPLEMARFFEKLQAQGGSRAPALFSSHPDPGNRMKTIQDEIRYLPSRDYREDSPEFQRIKQRVAGGVRGFQTSGGARQQTGLSQSGSARPPDLRPSGRYREFAAREFQLRHPDNWQAFGDQQAATVTLAPREGLVQTANGGTAVGYGATISYYMMDGQRVNLRQGTAALVRQLQQSNPGLRSGGQQQVIDVGGARGLLTPMEGASPFQSEREVNLLVTAARPEGLFYFVFTAPVREFNDVRGVFEEMVRSIRFRS